MEQYHDSKMSILINKSKTENRVKVNNTILVNISFKLKAL